MKIVHLIFVSTVFALLNVDSAKTQEVLSGEHGAFSRLVFEFPENETWVLTTGEGSARLKFSLPDFTLDVRNVFKRIDNSRLKNIVTTPGYLSIDLGCECGIEVSRHRNKFVIVDISDPKNLLEEVSDALISGSTMWHLQPLAKDYSVVEKFFEFHIGKADPPIDVGNTLSNQFRNGISAGILDGLVNGLVSPKQQDSAIAYYKDLAKLRQSELPIPPPNRSVEQLKDVSPKSDLGDRVTLSSIKKSSCASEYFLTLDMWKEGDNFERVSSEIQALIANAPNARSQRDAVFYATMKYFSLGFGAEGRALLESFGYKEDFLTSISYLLDGETLGPASYLSNGYGCRSQMALWAIVSQGSIPPKAHINEDELVNSVMELPPFVKKAIGEKLVQRLRSANFFTSAVRLETALNLKTIDPLVSKTQYNSTSDLRPFNSFSRKSELSSANADIAIINDLSRYISKRSAAPDYIRSHGVALFPIIADSQRRINLLKSIILSDFTSGNTLRGSTLLKDYTSDNRLGKDFWTEFEDIVSNHLEPAQFILIYQVLLLNPPIGQDKMMNRLKRISDGLGFSDLEATEKFNRLDASSLLKHDNPVVVLPDSSNADPLTSANLVELDPGIMIEKPSTLARNEIKDTELLLDHSHDLRVQAAKLLELGI